MRRLGGLVAASMLVMAMGAGCSSGVPRGASGRATTTEPPKPITFTVASFDVAAAAAPLAGTTEGAWTGVESTLNRWLDEAIVRPLRSGQPPGDIGAIFTAAVREHMAGTADRAVFVAEGLPPATGVAAQVATLAMVALGDPTGNLPLVTVRVDLRLEGAVEGAPLSVENTGEVVMVPDGDAWRIDGYEMRATRVASGSSTTTTARS